MEDQLLQRYRAAVPARTNAELDQLLRPADAVPVAKANQCIDLRFGFGSLTYFLFLPLADHYY